MTQTCHPLAYLVSRYPAISHTFILREIAHLRDLGHTIHTVSVNPPDRARTVMDRAEHAEAEQTYCLKEHGLVGAIMALAFWLMRTPLALYRVAEMGRRFGWFRGLAYAVEAAMVARWMHQRGLRHLHVHFGNAGASVGVLVKALTGCHLSYTIHGPDEFDDVLGQQLQFKMEQADSIICISQFARSQLMRISDPIHWPKFRVIHLGVDPAVYCGATPVFGRTTTELICVGRLTPAKGQVLLIQACAALRDKGVSFHLHIIGDGPDRDRICAAIAKHQLASHVTLHGALTPARVQEALRQADVFVLPSLAEGIPVVLMEAMASRLPCVSTPVNGIPELIEHGRDGLLAIPGDVASLTDQLRSLCTQPALRAEMAHRARQKVQRRFDLRANVAALSATFSLFPKV